MTEDATAPPIKLELTSMIGAFATFPLFILVLLDHFGSHSSSDGGFGGMALGILLMPVSGIAGVICLFCLVIAIGGSRTFAIFWAILGVVAACSTLMMLA